MWRRDRISCQETGLQPGRHQALHSTSLGSLHLTGAQLPGVILQPARTQTFSVPQQKAKPRGSVKESQYLINPYLHSIPWLNSPIIQACLHWRFDFREGKMMKTLWKVIVRLKKCWMHFLCKTYSGYPCYQTLITWAFIPKSSISKAAIHYKDFVVNGSSWERGKRKFFAPAWRIQSILKKKKVLLLSNYAIRGQKTSRGLSTHLRLQLSPSILLLYVLQPNKWTRTIFSHGYFHLPYNNSHT